MSTLQRARPKSQQQVGRLRTVAQTQTQTQTVIRTQARAATQQQQEQAARLRQAEVVKQSVEAVKQLVVAGLSCVAYLRWVNGFG